MNTKRKEIISRAEVSEEFGWSTSFLEKHPEIPSLQIARRIYYRRSELEAWLEAHRRESSDELRTLVNEVVSKIEKGRE